jgi:hypothetical protein
MPPKSFSIELYLGEGQTNLQKLTREKLVARYSQGRHRRSIYILDSKGDYLFTGLEEHKDKINEFRPRLESLVTRK